MSPSDQNRTAVTLLTVVGFSAAALQGSRQDTPRASAARADAGLVPLLRGFKMQPAILIDKLFELGMPFFLGGHHLSIRHWRRGSEGR